MAKTSVSTSAGPSTLEARVRKQLPAARRLLIDGGLDPTKNAQIEEFIDASEPDVDLTDDQLTQFSRWTDSAFILGVAVGLLLNGSAFLHRER